MTPFAPKISLFFHSISSAAMHTFFTYVKIKKYLFDFKIKCNCRWSQFLLCCSVTEQGPFCKVCSLITLSILSIFNSNMGMTLKLFYKHQFNWVIYRKSQNQEFDYQTYCFAFRLQQPNLEYSVQSQQKFQNLSFYLYPHLFRRLFFHNKLILATLAMEICRERNW